MDIILQNNSPGALEEQSALLAYPSSPLYFLWFAIHGFQERHCAGMERLFQMGMCWHKQHSGQPSVLKINKWSKGIAKRVRALPLPLPFLLSFSLFFFFLKESIKNADRFPGDTNEKLSEMRPRNGAEGAASERNSPCSFGSWARNHHGSSDHTKAGEGRERGRKNERERDRLPTGALPHLL